MLAEFTLPSEEGNDQVAAERVAEAARGVGLGARRLARLQTAVGEAALNAIEHGNQLRPERAVGIRAGLAADALWVEVSDEGGERSIPEPETPDIEAKLAGRERARGWGLFLMHRLADEVRVTTTGGRHTVRLTFRLGDDDSNHGGPSERAGEHERENAHGSAV